MEFMKKTLDQVNTQENTLYDFIYNLVFFMSLKQSEEDIRCGRVCTLEDLEAEMEAKYESYRNAGS